MRNKIAAAVALIVIIPLLAAYYLSTVFNEFAVYSKGIIIMITGCISVLGMAYLMKFIRLVSRLYETLNIIADGNLNQQVKVGKSSGAENLAGSINKVSRQIRQNADELEKRAILIERTEQELKKKDMFKSMYLSNIAHELRAPLINIEKSSVFLLEKKENIISDDSGGFLKIINDNAKRLIRLVSDLLDISKIEAGEFAMRKEKIDINEIIEAASNSVKGWRQSKELDLQLEVARDITDIYADKDKIIQVIINLLSNAIKFTPAKGTITIEAKIFNADGAMETKYRNDEFISISVKDTGPGMTEAQKSTLFIRYRLEQEIGSYKNLPGTGLGLPIARQIVELHGGKLWAESQPGYGSKFIFILPKRIKRKLFSAAASQALKRRILVIDDENTVRDLLSRALNKKGYDVNTAVDGFEGVKKVMNGAYNVVITDIHMPMMDGLNCINILKKLTPASSIIVITGFPLEESLRGLLEKESYPLIKKPFDLPELLKTVERACFSSVEA